MNAIDLLKQHHDEVKSLFDQIEAAEGEAPKAKLFRELAGKLVGHDGIEREIFYPACEEALGLTDNLGEALVEHGVVEFSLYQADQALGAPDFDFKLKVLRELLEHHIDEEEDELFPKVRSALGDEKLDSLGEELLEAFEDALEEDYHAPLFENLRQVLVGVLKPAVKDADDEAARPRRSARNGSARTSSARR
jgi:hemerythrin-like domain-containing protein